MGSLTRSNMRDEVRLAIGQRQSDELSDDRVDRWIDWAYNHVARPNIHRHREMKALATTSLVQGQQTYSITSGGDFNVSDFLAVIDVTDTTTPVRYTAVGIHVIDEIESTQEGRARFYAVYYDNTNEEVDLVLDREPNSQEAGNTLQLRYWRQPPSFSGDGDTTILLPDWDEVIVVGAIHRGLRTLLEPERAEVYKAEFGQLINEVTERVRLEREDEGIQVVDVEQFPYQETI